MNKVYIVEDESVLRDLYRDYFALALPEFELVGMGEDGCQAMRDCRDLQPDLVLLDIMLPEISGLELLKIIKEQNPAAKVGFLTGSVCPDSINEAVRGGADGFIEKAGGLEQLKTALSAIFSGEKYFSPNVLRQVKIYNASASFAAAPAC